MKQPIQAWFDKWLAEHEGSDLYYKDAASAQVQLVRDTLAALVWADVPYWKRANEGEPRTDCKVTGYVISEHRSKSVRLPVYLFERADLGIRFVLRNNFYDWKLSVMSENPIQSDLFPYLFHTTPPIEREYTGDELAHVYFEGFPKDLIFGYHGADPRRWSASLGDRALWTTILLCMRSVGGVKPMAWHTRESHCKALDEESAARATQKKTP
jgi:hypothetical protein